MENTEEQVKEVIAEKLCTEAKDVKNESRLMDDLGADSLDCVELTMAVEDKFNIEISDEEAEKLFTVNDIIECVKKKKDS